MPSIQGGTLEAEGWKVKFLQLNLGRGNEAQDLLMPTARERRDDMLFISEQHKWSENSFWYQDASRRAGILVCSPDLSIGNFLKTDAGFVWVKVEGVRVYSCYFSPNDPFEIFRKALERLVGGLLLRVTLIVSRPCGEKPAWTGGGSWSVRWSLGMT